MRIALVAVVGTGLAAAVPAGMANAAVAIDVAAIASARCRPGALVAEPSCLRPAMLASTPASTLRQGPTPRTADAVPPAAIAGIVGLLALAAAFRPRRGGRATGLPEVTS